MLFKKRITGRLKKQATLKKDEEDIRDHLLMGSTADKRIILKEYSSLVKNQGSANSCTAHAAVLVYEMEQRINSRRWVIDGSEQFNYYYGRKLGNLFPDDGGAYLRDTCKAMKSYGVCPEKLMPYNAKNINYNPGVFAYAFSNVHYVIEDKFMYIGVLGGWLFIWIFYPAIILAAGYFILRAIKSLANSVDDAKGSLDA